MFYDLDKLKPGDKVTITRRDGSVAELTTDRIESYDKDSFPTNEGLRTVPRENQAGAAAVGTHLHLHRVRSCLSAR